MHIKDDVLLGLCVLVVEDDADERDMLALVLAHRGARVRAVGSAREALEAIRAEPPDVLVSDISLAGEDGYGLVRELRSWPAAVGGAVPAVAVTGWCRAADCAKALDAGFQAHLGKPVALESLVAVVASLAGSRHTPRAGAS